MGKGKIKPTPKAAPQATPSEADTAQVKRSSQQEAARRKKRQQTVFGGSSSLGANNVLG